MFEVKTFNSINEIDKDLWDSIIDNDRIICRYDFLQATEESHINDCKFYYLLIYDGKILAACTWIYTMSMDLVTQIIIQEKDIAGKIIRGIRKSFPNFLITKILECGSPIALGNNININSNYDIKEILPSIINSMIGIGKEKKARFLIMRDFYEKDIVALNVFFKNQNFIFSNNLSDVDLINQWDSFEDYIKKIRFKYRRYYKICNSALVDGNITIEITDDFKDHVPRILELYFNFYNHAKDYRREILTADFFYNTSKYLKDKVKVLLLKKDNIIIGFGYFILDDYTIRLLYGGMDYDTKDKYKTYFNIYYQLLKFAMNNKIKKIELGLTSYDFKIWLGGQIVPLYVYLHHLNPFINFMLKLFSKSMFQETKTVFRHPFQKGNDK
jgi:predicted N-acyltransferase